MSGRAKSKQERDHEYRMALLFTGEKKWTQSFKLLGSITKSAAVIACFWIAFGALASMASQNASSLQALASIVKHLHMREIVYILIAGASSGLYIRERKAKQRIIARLGESENKLEKQDAYNASSGLTRYGCTPKEED